MIHVQITLGAIERVRGDDDGLQEGRRAEIMFHPGLGAIDHRPGEYCSIRMLSNNKIAATNGGVHILEGARLQQCDRKHKQ